MTKSLLNKLVRELQVNKIPTIKRNGKEYYKIVTIKGTKLIEVVSK